MKVTYTEEAIADIVEAITFINERNPTTAAKLDGGSRAASNAWQRESLTGRSHVFVRKPWCAAGACRLSGCYYQRHPDELLIVRVYHQARRPITR